MIFLLCKHGEDLHEWYVISASDLAAPLIAEALRLNEEEYAAERKAWLDAGKVGPETMPLDDPRRRGYQTYYVKQVPRWPSVAD